MEKLDYIEKEVNDLKLDQSKTSQEVSFLAREVDSHIKECKEMVEKDDKRHEKQQESLARLTESTAAVVTNVNQFIPEARKEFKVISVVAAEQKSQSWLLKSIVGVVIIAALGSFTSSAITCNLSEFQQQLQESNNKTNMHPVKAQPLAKRRQSMNSTEANSMKGSR